MSDKRILLSSRTFLLKSLSLSLFQTSTSAVQENPLNLSILISGGKENNSDFLSNGE